jgi:nucleoside 2-deoxyribosyltransferase
MSGYPPARRRGLIMARIYLAASFRKRFAMQGHRADLQRLGHTVVSRWIDLAFETEADALQCAHADIEDLELADTLIAFTDPPRSTNSRGGHHYEAGYAHARGLRLIVIGCRENVFHHLHEFYQTWPEALRALTPQRRLAA